PHRSRRCRVPRGHNARAVHHPQGRPHQTMTQAAFRAVPGTDAESAPRVAVAVSQPRPTAGVTATDPAIRLKSLRKVFRGKTNVHLAVSDVSMDIDEGDFVSLVGPSGCGKTTILKILAGLYRVDDGMIALRSDFKSGLAEHHVGMVFQQPLLLKWRTILENVML